MDGIVIHPQETLEQRSSEWYKIREGKITASNVSNILGKITLKSTLNAIDNMAREKAIESVHGMIESDYVSFDMQRGIDQEPEAFRCLQRLFADDFIELYKIGFAEYSEHSGASPDGLSSDGANVEIKCPNSKNFFKHTLTKEINIQHYAQMQKQMLCTKTKKTYYFNYCVHLGKEFWDLRTVERDEDMIKLILERESIVISKKLNYIEILKSIQAK
jgi:putative phage-type endonuclease